MIKTTVIAASLLLTFTPLVNADVVSLVDSEAVPNSAEGVLRPTRGMTMARVQQKFGQAEQASSPVGEPPITVWTYSDFKVYFEHNIVIYSVVAEK